MSTLGRVGEQFAAVDLGSNSFHMVVAQQTEDNRLSVVDRIKINVRLAGGLDESGVLSPDAQQRALDCLRSFGERLKDIPQTHVRAVGTNTLRKASNVVGFLDAACDALGHPIDVISGREEARLIYRGVVRDVEEPGRLLVIDIGGGSTELIVGENEEPTRLDSLFMGCVSWSVRFFPNGIVNEERMERAMFAARQELHGVVRAYRKAGWDTAVGSSGTINAIERILLAKGYASVTVEGLEWICRRMYKAKKLRHLNLDGLSTDRRPVLAGGVAILRALFTALRMDALQATSNALREGVLLELVGREQHRDIREDTVKRMIHRFEVDGRQAFRVAQTATILFDQVQEVWALGPRERALLRWSAMLHEIGMFLTYTGYHKHSAYLLTHHDMPGFSRQDQRSIAGLVLGHRGRIRKRTLSEVTIVSTDHFSKLLILLRIATRIHRRRSPKPPPKIHLNTTGTQVNIELPVEWLSERPLTKQDLEQDSDELRIFGYDLRIVER